MLAKNRLAGVMCARYMMIVPLLLLAGCGGGGSSPTNNGGGGGDPAPNVTVSISPKRAAVSMSSQTQQFTATVTGDSQNRGITWSVDNAAGGNATVGVITSSGLYTPP